MKFRDLVRLVWSNLNRMRTRAVMSGVGVLIGTAAIVILVALAAGLQRSATQSLSSLGPLNEISLSGGALLRMLGARSGGEEARLTPKVLADLASQPGVVALTPRVPLAGSAEIQLDRLTGFATLTGVDARQIRKLGWNPQAGALLLGRWQVVVGARVGEGFADPRHPTQVIKLAPKDVQGQTLKLTVTRTTADGKTAKRTVRLRVAGVLAERGGQDDYAIFLALPDMDDLNSWISGKRPNPARDGYDQATIVMEKSDQVAPVVQDLLQRGFFAYSAASSLQQINIFFVVIQAIMGGIGAIALLVAGIGIANTLTMSIFERTREIGLMKAVGATNRDVMSVFLAEAGGIGLLGGLGGVLVGWLVTVIINGLARAYIGAQAAAAGAAAGSYSAPDVAFIPLWLPLAVLLFAIAMGALSGIYPAQRATQLNPVTALKYE